MEIVAAAFYKIHTSSSNFTITDSKVSSIKIDGNVNDLEKKQELLKVEKSSSAKVNKIMTNTQAAVRVFVAFDGKYFDWGNYVLESVCKHHFELVQESDKKRKFTEEGVTTRSQKRTRSSGTSADTALVTEYAGVRFRSRLEARTAVFMDSVNIKWKYEVFTCRFPPECDKSSYTPDFFLPELQLFVEIKPAFPHIDEMKACEDFVKTTGTPIILLFGDALGSAYRCSKKDGGRFYSHANVQRGMTWDSEGQRIGGDVLWIRSEDGSVVLGNISSVKDDSWDDEEIIAKLQLAATYNFN